MNNKAIANHLRSIADQLDPPRKPVEVIPWVECMWPMAGIGAMTQREAVISGMQTWSEVATRGIVTTLRHDEWGDVHSQVNAAARLDIIPGLKPYAPGTHRILVGALDDVDGWGRVAEEVKRLGQMCGTVLMDIEELSKPYVNGGLIDHQKLRAGLAKLPTDIEYWWYPGVWGNTATKRANSHTVARHVRDVLGKSVRFVDQLHQGQATVMMDSFVDASRMLHYAAVRPVLPQLMFYGNNPLPPDWPDDKIGDALSRCDDVALVYPGIHRFASSAADLVQGVKEWRNA